MPALTCAPLLTEGPSGRALGGLHHGAWREAERARHHQFGKLPRQVVVVEHRVVVRLPGKADAVLGAGQLLGQRADRFVGLQLGIGLGQHHQPAQAARQRLLGGLHGLGGGRIGRAAAQGVGGTHGVAAGPRDGLQRGGLMREVTLCRGDEVGNEVVPALELHVDLPGGIGNAVAALHEPVEGPHHP